ncbi:glycerol transporter [Dipsacomyces acuminosporus]|nr:glycerol transporter [Dipsacomyces acuminosporus]
MSNSSVEHIVHVGDLHTLPEQQENQRQHQHQQLSSALLLSPLSTPHIDAGRQGLPHTDSQDQQQLTSPMATGTAAASADNALMPGITKKPQRRLRVPTEPLWGTLEFKLYYVLYLIVVPNMLYTMYKASSPGRPEYEKYKHELSQGWMFGRMVDLSDGQWDTFRSHLPAFAGAMLAYVALNRLFRAAVVRQRCRGFLQSPASVRGALPTLWFPCTFATAFVVALSGTSTIFIFALVSGNYLVAKKCGGQRWAPLAFWAYNMAMLFSNEHFKGYEFARMAGSLAWLDEWRGILRRWDVTFNITMLRMVSFAMDYHWRVGQKAESSSRQVDAIAAKSPGSEKERVEHSCFAQDYCFANYWAYLFYPPLYLTGPIITFNSFISQMRFPSSGISPRSTVVYGFRLLASILLMELMLHTVHCVAISKWGQWDTFTVYEISLFGYMRLTFIWLKLLIIWRFARFWAMADGLETVENMRRCMSNNYSLQQFWRDWHCSYNKWLVRYVYIPLGGRKTSTWNTFVVFTFVALWHDLTMKLLEWAWIIALLFLPEGLATWYFNRPRWSRRPYFRYICSVGGAVNIIAMMIANLVGFGDEGVDKMLDKIFSRSGLVFLVVTYALFNVHLQVMFEWREHGYRKEYAASSHGSSQLELVQRKAATGSASGLSADTSSDFESSLSPAPEPQSLRQRPAPDQNSAYSS